MKYIEQSVIYYTELAGSQYPIYTVCYMYISTNANISIYISTPYSVYTATDNGIQQQKRNHFNIYINIRYTATDNALCNKRNGSYVVKDFGTLPLIFSRSKYFRWFQHCPSFFHKKIFQKMKKGPVELRAVGEGESESEVINKIFCRLQHPRKDWL